MFLRNEKGQMAIFIALFFQVLFVFFAMAINVGLVVHDKINLQNAVDLAAYYGAAKQAEIMNQIAHINYQMRQNYKLLVWRYRVLGTLGDRSHPLSALPNAQFRTLNTLLTDYDITVPASPSDDRLPPVVCVAHSYWQEYNFKDPDASWCSINVNVPNIPPASGGGAFVPGYGNLVTYTQQANAALIDQCEEAGAVNWQFASRILTHFRVDGMVRKDMIRNLATNLSRNVDLKGESIEEGVRNTLQNNLTDGHYDTNIEYFNSMAQGGACGSPDNWLVDIRIQPVLMYKDFDGDTNACVPIVAANRPLPAPGSPDPMPVGIRTNPRVRAIYGNSVLEDHWLNEPSGTMHSSVGFEKNPWCMVYSGVRATSQVRKPFSPTGPVTLTAHGFAKPFGGRIGPWYGKTWPSGSGNSVAAGGAAQMVDPLLPSREVSGGGAAGSAQNDTPNHSRYPGDTLGMKSARAVSSMIGSFKSQVVPPPPGARNASPLALGSYDFLGGVNLLRQMGDSLARNATVPNVGPKQAVVRPFELAATAPDTFDVLYYSIEPRYHNLYFAGATNNGASLNQNDVIYDFGSVKSAGAHPGSAAGNGLFESIGQVNTRYMQEIDYIVRQWPQVLTSWHQNEAVEFSMDRSRFGRCRAPVTRAEYPTTGNCIEGGRTGYSVKNISRDFLISSEHELGGQSVGTGAILNQPSF